MYLLAAVCIQEKDLPYAILSNWNLGQTAAQPNFVHTPLQASVSALVFTLKHTTCSWHLRRVELGTPGLCHRAVWAELGLCKDQKGQDRTPTGTPSLPHLSCGRGLCLFAVKISVPAEVCFSTQSEIRWVVIAE